MRNNQSSFSFESNSIGYLGSHGIDAFHRFLMEHPKCSKYTHEEWDLIFQALRIAENMHLHDMRKKDQRPYIHHQIEIILDALSGFEVVPAQDIIVYALHDLLEDHSECWRQIIDIFGLAIFRDVLVLTTNGFGFSERKEVLDYIRIRYLGSCDVGVENLSQYVGDKTRLIVEIMKLLAIQDPLVKIHDEQRYQDSLSREHYDAHQVYQKLERAVALYKKGVFQMRKKMTNDQIRLNPDYIGLGNYVFFHRNDCRRKLADMLHNMSDMGEMEKIKPGYIDVRLIKAYILGVQLRHYGMIDGFAQLQRSFNIVGKRMYSDVDVAHFLNGATLTQNVDL